MPCPRLADVIRGAANGAWWAQDLDENAEFDTVLAAAASMTHYSPEQLNIRLDALEDKYQDEKKLRERYYQTITDYKRCCMFFFAKKVYRWWRVGRLFYTIGP